MARSVAELLPRPFAEITLGDVAQIIESARAEEGETLWFERKAAITGNSISKACAAFANTYGGLLVVGVADEDDALVGIKPLAAEAKLWVKDTLRGLVLPMPPFRARWLPTNGGRGLLLVLIEESSTTPHLLLRSGAIYVRNPGSSDPVPIGDQRRLLDLTRRGEEAEATAKRRAAQDVLPVQLHNEPLALTEKIALVPTGIPADFEERVFAPTTPELLARTAWGEANEREADQRTERWFQDLVGVERKVIRPLYAIYGIEAAGVTIDRLGGLCIYRGIIPPDQRELDDLRESTIRERFLAMLKAAREILAEFGAHGDLRLAYQLTAGQGYVHFDVAPDRGGVNGIGERRVERWASLDDDTVADGVFAEIRRAVGLGPRAPE